MGIKLTGSARSRDTLRGSRDALLPVSGGRAAASDGFGQAGPFDRDRRHWGLVVGSGVTVIRIFDFMR
jgi:hypothetical protein